MSSESSSESEAENLPIFCCDPAFRFNGMRPPALLFLTLASMGVLFAVFVLSLVALIWTVIALRRHIHNHDVRGSEPLRLEGAKNDDPLKNLD